MQKPSSQKPVLGFDFGTTNTVASWYDASGEIRYVPVDENRYVLASVVSYRDRGEPLVGEIARREIIERPHHTITGVKRFLGRRYSSDFVARHKRRYAWKIVAGSDGQTAAEIDGRQVPLRNVAADIVKRMVELANIALGSPFEQCALAVPAHYSQRQRNMLREVVERAGLSVKTMLNEPTAAALYYAKDRDTNGLALVYDFGGGTFDTSILELKQGVVKVLATGGDAFFGGADLDALIVKELIERFERRHGIDLGADAVVIQRLFFAAEIAKIRLSEEARVQVRLPCVAQQGDDFVGLEETLTRGELDRICTPAIERTIGMSLDLLKQAGIKPENVELLMVGGQTRMPAVRSRLSSVFRFSKTRPVDPDLAVAVGAASIGAERRVLTDVLSVPVHIMSPGGLPLTAIGKHTRLPCVRRLMPIQRPAANASLSIIAYEAVEPQAIERDILGTLRVQPSWLQANEGELSLEVRMERDYSLQFAIRAGNATPKVLEFESDARTEPEAPGVADPMLRSESRMRFQVPVSVRAVGETDFTFHRSFDISRTGLFVVMDNPYIQGTQVEVMLSTDVGPIMVQGRVVRAFHQGADDDGGEPSGMGVNFKPLDAAQRHAMTALLDRLSRQAQATDSADDDEDEEIVLTEVVDLDEAVAGAQSRAASMQALKRFFVGMKANQIYEALDLQPLTPRVQVQERIETLRDTISELIPKVSQTLAGKLWSASQVLDRMSLLLLDPMRRVAYDFQKGMIFAKQRIALASQGGPEITLLHEVWQKVFPTKVLEAQRHVARALKAKQEVDLRSALVALTAAIQCDPFNLSLQQLEERWKAE